MEYRTLGNTGMETESARIDTTPWITCRGSFDEMPRPVSRTDEPGHGRAIKSAIEFSLHPPKPNE